MVGYAAFAANPPYIFAKLGRGCVAGTVRLSAPAEWNGAGEGDHAKRVEGACSKEVRLTARAPSTALLRSAVPLPRFAGQDERESLQISLGRAT